MNVLISGYSHYDYLIATIAQGLKSLGHNAYGTDGNSANYLGPHQGQTCQLFIQCIPGKGPHPVLRSAMLWGADNHIGLEREFKVGFDAVFVRDHVGGPGIPMNFSIELRYYAAIEGTPKPLKNREIDICFLGQLGYAGRREYVERLKVDFAGYRLELGERKFCEPDDYWSKWTLPWAAHDIRYFQTLTNSKICLAFKGAGPDTGRLWECFASGAMVIAERLGTKMVTPPPQCLWFDDYEQLAHLIKWTLENIETAQGIAREAWLWNRIHHTTEERAAYLLGKLGY